MNKDDEEWMTKPILYYDTFVMLYGNDQAIGEKLKIAKKLKIKQSSKHDNESQDNIKEIDCMILQSQGSLEGFGNYDATMDSNMSCEPFKCGY